MRLLLRIIIKYIMLIGLKNIFPQIRPLVQFRFGVVKFNLPDLGEKIKEGTIKKLYISEGD